VSDTTSSNARQIAALFEGIAESVENYRDQNYSALGPKGRAALDSVLQHLYDLHDRFTGIAIQRTLEFAQEQVDQIIDVTKRAETALKHLRTTQKIIQIASSIAELGEAITTADYGAIPEAIKSASDALSNDSDD